MNLPISPRVASTPEKVTEVCHPSFVVAETLEVFFRHKWKSISFFLLSVTLAVGYIALAPRTYQSTAKLMMRVGRQTITLDPTATVGQTMLVQKSHESEINSALEILDSRAVLKKAVERVGVDRVLGKDQVPSALSQAAGRLIRSLKSSLDYLQPPVAMGTTSGDHEAPATEAAVRRLQSKVTVSSPKNSMIISVTTKASSPELAHEFTQAIQQVFLEEYVRVNQTSGSHEFFKNQALALREKLDAAQGELADRQKEFGFLTVAGQQALLEERLKDVELTLLQTNRAAAFAKSKAAQLQELLAVVPKEQVLSTQSGIPNAAKDQMRAMLYALQIEEFSSPYAPAHPLAAAKKAQRDSAAEIIASEPDKREQNTVGINPTYQTLETELKTQQAELAALESQHEILTGQASAIRQELLALADQQTKMTDLERKVELLDLTYRTHFDKLEQARVDAELEALKISNVSVVQEASFVRRPTSPKKSLTLLAGLLAGILGAAGLPFLIEFFDSSLREPQQIETALGLPVVLQVPLDGQYRRSVQRLAAGG